MQCGVRGPRGIINPLAPHPWCGAARDGAPVHFLGSAPPPHFVWGFEVRVRFPIEMMLLHSNILILLGNAVTSRRIYSILLIRVTVIILLPIGLMPRESLFVSCKDTRIGVYNGLFHSTRVTHTINLQFLNIIGAIILLLTALCPFCPPLVTLIVGRSPMVEGLLK